MEDKILIWLNSKPLISVNRLCKMVDYNMSNFQKSAKQGIVPLKIRSRLVEVLSEYGYSETTDYEIPKSFDASKEMHIDTARDKFKIHAQQTTKSSLDESVISEPPKQISIAQYKDRILSSIDFPNDLKDIAEQIKIDEYLTTPQKRDLLASFGAK